VRRQADQAPALHASRPSVQREREHRLGRGPRQSDLLQPDPPELQDKEHLMEGSRFDAWTRRQFGRAAAGGVATLLGVAALDDTAAKKGKNNKKKGCKKKGQHCRQEFIENCSDQDVDDTGGCTRAIKRCCGKCKGKSEDQLFEQCGDVLCQFKEFC